MDKLTTFQRHEKRRKEIVAAAKQCVAEKGFHAASVDMIAKAAKINVGQLYRYFDTKESIIEAISQDVFDRTIREIRKHNGLKGLFKADKTDIQIMSEIHAEAARNPVVDRIMNKAEKRMAEVLKEEIKKTAPHISDQEIENAEAMLAVLTGGLFLLVLRRKNWPQKKTKELSDAMFRLVLPCLAKNTD
ncbi:MAG: TetR/AcrR family transcriptional regulator [Candidatus Avelusimicrobium sp.]